MAANKDPDGSVWISAPQPTPGSYHQAGDCAGAWLMPGEEVVWLWENNRVVGYTIINKANARFIREMKP